MFWLNGVAFASWAARLPAVKERLELSSAGLGVLLLCLSGGAVLGLPLSGAVVQGRGPARAGAGGVAAVVAGQLVLAAGLGLAAVWVVGAALFVLGIGMSTWDVSMNVQGAGVERRHQRTLMPRFHASYSLGAVSGALVASGAAATGIDVSVQLVTIGPMIAVGAGWALRRYATPGVAASNEPLAQRRLVAAWTHRPILVLGLVVFGFALSEGVANDWLAFAFTDGLGASSWIGSLGFGAFSAAMTVARFGGEVLIGRFGRVGATRLTAVLAITGTLLVVTAPSIAIALVGSAAWGIGTSLGFPIGMSAAADDPIHAAARVSVVSTIGYTAFLAGPPIVGLLADTIGVRPALAVVPIALTASILVANSAGHRSAS